MLSNPIHNNNETKYGMKMVRRFYCILAAEESSNAIEQRLELL